MTTLRVGIGIIWSLTVLTGHGASGPSGVAECRPSSRRPIIAFVANDTPATETHGLTLDRRAEPHVDVRGNEVDDALADYRFDGRGTIYERHSPDTSVSKLGSPRV
jgi:hypothetical protein